MALSASVAYKKRHDQEQRLVAEYRQHDIPNQALTAREQPVFRFCSDINFPHPFNLKKAGGLLLHAQHIDGSRAFRRGNGFLRFVRSLIFRRVHRLARAAAAAAAAAARLFALRLIGALFSGRSGWIFEHDDHAAVRLFTLRMGWSRPGDFAAQCAARGARKGFIGSSTTCGRS